MIRFFDILLSVILLLVLSPIFILLIILIIFDSKGGAIYSQNRVGQYGKQFKFYKFRSMSINSDNSSLLTVGNNDVRITKIGYYLRKYKLDELPQLYNVFKGDMGFVGPRPEVRKYVDLYNDKQREVLNIRPGITDYASIEFVNENEILAKSENPEKTYIDEVLPKKLELNFKYLDNQTLAKYFKIIFLTIFSIVKN